MSRICIHATWDDVPHLSEEQKAQLWESIPLHERDARAKGIPVLGAGRIYPVAESDILIKPFQIPSYWPRAYALDVGWNRTAAVWGAHDRETDIVYLTHEYYAAQQPPSVHAAAIHAAGGRWQVGAIDPAAAGANQKDGSRLIDEYRELDLGLVEADNTVEAGIFAVYQRLSRGGLKVFEGLGNWLKEYRIYRRDEKGKVVKENDHLMDATRYLIMTGMAHAQIEPSETEEMEHEMAMAGRNPYTGY